MRVVMTGGTGLIGRVLAASLTSDGHEVIILSRSPERARGLPDGARIVQWDGRTADGWGMLVDGADAVVNLAGESIAGASLLSIRWTPERKRRIRESRVNAGRAVTQAIEATTRKPAVLIQSAAVGYYGPRGDEAITEESAAGGDFLAQVCQDWEASTEPVEEMGVRRAIIRTGVVLSTEGGALPRLLLPFKFIIAGGPLGSGRQWFPWIHLEDEVSAIRFLIDNQEASGPFNLTAPNPLTNADFAHAIGRTIKRPAMMPMPGFVFKLAFGEASTVLLDGQRALPRRLQEKGFAFRFTEAEEALRNLLQ